MRRDFVANISHELKTPVGALGLLAETIADEDDPTVARRLAERMLYEATRVGRTIDDLLELSRIEAEEPHPPEPVPVNLIVAEAVERIRPAAEYRGTPIEVTEAPRSLTILGDRRQLVSAVHNLLDNATKYSEPGRTIEVALAAGRHQRRDRRPRPRHGHPRPRPRAHLRALLPGRPGPQPRDRRHRARAGDRAPRRQQPRRRVPRRVPRGRGLAVHPVAPGRPGRIAADPPPGGGLAMATPDTTVLVVEDEDSFVDALTVGLKREGFRVQIARDGAQALELFDAVKPDLVLLDVMLPKVSGIDVCREIRSKSKVPIIMVTAKGSEIDTVVGLEVGADDYVTKPYRLRELVARIRAVLRRTPLDAHAALLSGDALEVGDVSLDPERHEVIIRGDQVSLPLKEFELLGILLENAGRVLTRETLIDRVWGADYVGRHQDPRRAHQAAAGQGRGRPVEPEPHRHDPGARLQVRAAPERQGRGRRLGRSSGATRRSPPGKHPHEVPQVAPLVAHRAVPRTVARVLRTLRPVAEGLEIDFPALAEVDGLLVRMFALVTEGLAAASEAFLAGDRALARAGHRLGPPGRRAPGRRSRSSSSSGSPPGRRSTPARSGC